MPKSSFVVEYLFIDPLLPSGWYVIPMHPKRPQEPFGPFREYKDCVRYIESANVR